MKNITIAGSFLSAVLLVLAVAPVIAQVATGGPYTLHQSVVANGGGVSIDAVNNNYRLEGTSGQSIVGRSTASPYSLQGGFWPATQSLPTAANGSISGRISRSGGEPLEGVLVKLEGTQNRHVVTDSDGLYRFENIETTGFYVITPSRANYTFNPFSHLVGESLISTEKNFLAIRSSGNPDNPVDTAEYFVRQHYVDFLSREPDESGFNFWRDQMLSCGSDEVCLERKRVNVSAAYFLSIEFQQTARVVNSLYRTSFSRRPLYLEFARDAATVGADLIVGKAGWQNVLEGNKQAFVDAWVQSPAFLATYGTLADVAYVDALISNTGVNFTADERNALVSGLANRTATRAGVLGQIAEDPRFTSLTFNEDFVMMEYFGYLRRDPDESGFQFWLNKLNEFNGNFEQAEMVKAFLVSGEYRDRFTR